MAHIACLCLRTSPQTLELHIINQSCFRTAHSKICNLQINFKDNLHDEFKWCNFLILKSVVNAFGDRPQSGDW